MLELEKMRRYARRQYNRLVQLPEYRYAHKSHCAAKALKITGQKFPGYFGTEGIDLEPYGYYNHCLTYLNSGDTYSGTVLFDSRNNRFSVGCWGDIVERLERVS